MLAPCANSLFLTPYRKKSNLNIMEYNMNSIQIQNKYYVNTVQIPYTKQTQSGNRNKTMPKNETIYPNRRLNDQHTSEANKHKSQN